MYAAQGAISQDDIPEFVRYSRTDGWRGPIGLYQSVLSEGAELTALALSNPLTMPALAVGGFGGPFTADTLRRVNGDVTSIQFDGVGH